MAIWLTGYNKAVYYVWISFLAKPSGKAVSLIVSQCDSTTSTVQYITVENNELDSLCCTSYKSYLRDQPV